MWSRRMKREFLRFSLKNSNTYIIHFLISWHQQASCPSPGFWFHWLQTFCTCLLACFKHLVILRVPNVTINKLMCLRTYFLAILRLMSGWWKALEVACSSSMLCTSLWGYFKYLSFFRLDHTWSRGCGHQHPGPWGGCPALLHREQVGGHHTKSMW